MIAPSRYLHRDQFSCPLPPGQVCEGLQQLLKVEERKAAEAYGPDTQCVGLARLGQPTQQIVVGTMR